MAFTDIKFWYSDFTRKIRVNCERKLLHKKRFGKDLAGVLWEKTHISVLHARTLNEPSAHNGENKLIERKMAVFHNTLQKNIKILEILTTDFSADMIVVNKSQDGEEIGNMRHADRVLLCTHGRFGEELKRSAEMIAGTMDLVKAFSLFPGMTPEELSDEIRAELDSCEAGICLVDIAGGTPFNVTARLAATYPIAVITGVNLQMLIEVHDSMDEMGYEALAQYAVDALGASGRVIYMKGVATHE